MTAASYYLIPAVLLIPSVLFMSGRGDYVGAFLRGAESGLRTAAGLVPPLVLIMSAISMFSASGASDAVSELIAPVCRALGIPEGSVPLLLTRPFSGAAANAAFTDLLSREGADGFSAFYSSVIMGSSDTAFYILSVYFSAARDVRKTGYAYPVAAASGVFCAFFSCFVCRLFF